MAPSELDLDRALEGAEKLIEYYQKVERESGIPKNVKDAVKEGFVLTIDALTEKALEHYSEKDRANDRQRLIPLSVAINLLQEYERKMVDEIVLDPFQLYYSSIQKLVALAGHIGQSIKLILQGRRFLTYLFGHALQAMAVGTYAPIVVAAVTIRRGIVSEMRRRALPHPRDRRTRQRKVAR